MKKQILRLLTGALCAALLLGFIPALAAEGEEETPEEERPKVSFITYGEALTYFDFSKAAYNWCANFGLDPETEQQTAINAILAGTDPQLIVALATFARDTGHEDEKLEVTNAFRPACYQEVIGLHDANANTGYFRNALRWNGRSVTEFWWYAESAAGWPEDYAIDLSAYDIATLDLKYYYRAALRLWDNTWTSNYYAKPGCSAHNSGSAMDLGNYWLAANFDTVFTVKGVDYDMADYGLYKPLQPGKGTAGETWHITSSPAVLALGNYDAALLNGYEVVHSLYYNPASRGWDMGDGRGVYLGAGVTLIQLRLCQLGLLEEKYITGYYCTYTENAVKAFQESRGLVGDGICGSGTAALLFDTGGDNKVSGDTEAPVLVNAEITGASATGFTLHVSGTDDRQLNAFRVDTRKEGSDVWVSRYYNAPVGGAAYLDIDTWEEGTYEVRAAACDAAGNESPLMDATEIFVDATPPTLTEIVIGDITESGFALTAKAEDNGNVAGFTVTLTSDTGENRENFLISDGSGGSPWTAENLNEGVWTVSVTAHDTRGNTDTRTLRWQFAAGGEPTDLTVTWYAPAA